MHNVTHIGDYTSDNMLIWSQRRCAIRVFNFGRTLRYQVVFNRELA